MGPGDVIAETYKVVRRLGAGGMGEVFEARHVRIPKRVAIKVLSIAPAADVLARFRQEAQIASRLAHPHIVDVIDLDALPDGIPYMVMELLDGENLRARMRREQVPIDAALKILRQIASALDAAHDAGVIHRDLKPENVFLLKTGLTGADHVKLLDFGISKVQGAALALTAENMVMGTPAYMAPEQAMGRTALMGPSIDQFALAMIGYELLGGALPFADADTTKMVQRILNDPTPPLAPLAPDAPPHVVAAIERALAKHPRDRFATISDFVDALGGKVIAPPAIEAVTVSERRVIEPRSVDEKAPRRPRWWILGVVLFAVSVCATSIVLVARRHTSTVARDSSTDGASNDRVSNDASSNVGLSSDARPANDASNVVAAIDPAIAPAGSAPADAAIAVPADAARPTARDAAIAKPESVIPPEVTAELDKAQTALRAGDTNTATRLARGTLDVAKTSRAYLILVEVACRKSDLGAARGWLRSMPASGARAARKICADVGLDL